MVKSRTQTIAVTGLLVALEIIFQALGNNVSLGPVSINLSLIPITVGAILYGPFIGAFLGFINGLLVLFSPSTMAVFMPLSLLGTIITCLTKVLIAGFLTGLIFIPFKKHKMVGIVLASLFLPIINTSVFIGYSFLFFIDLLNQGVNETFTNPFTYLIFGMIGWNFIFELATNVIIVPIVARVFIKKM